MKNTVNKKYMKHVAAALLFVMALIVFSNASFIAKSYILSDDGELDCPIYMTVGANGDRYIINKSMTQILILDADNNYKNSIDGGKETAKSFNFVNNIAVDKEGCIYASDVSYNSNYD
ncbi:MAG: hypothetical protein J1F64_08090 [Oscillospiraceae bacterium]|nr:hypothetical protein [Oscillospiraceae bacterium]